MSMSGCDKSQPLPPSSRKHIDAAWFRRSLLEDNLRHWLAAAPTPNGFFQAGLDRQWGPVGKQTATLVSQGRLLFNFAMGYELTSEPAYLAAVRQGAEFLILHFRDRIHGGVFWSVGPDGQVLDEKKVSYGHAFAIFGLAHAARVTGEPAFRNEALTLWAEAKARLFYAEGGLKPGTDRQFAQVQGGNTQNPMMHLFEALLALHDATGSPDVWRDALGLAESIYGRLFNEQEGYLAEFYDADWRPLAVEKGGYIDLGHQFEWAFLLSRAVEKGFEPHYAQIAGRLMDYGMAHGYDAANGGIFSRCDYGGKVSAQAKGWWQQVEHLRALANHAVLRGREDLWPAFDKSLAFVRQHFIDDQYGGWYGSYDPAKPRSGSDFNKGSVWKLGYHETGMYVEALRLAGM